MNGTAGRALVVDTVARSEIQASGSETAEVWQAGYFNDFNRQFALTMDLYLFDMVAALCNGDPPPVPATAGRRALQLACTAIEAHETGHRVEVPTPA